MNERREMYESYWAFKAGKWIKIDSANSVIQSYLISYNIERNITKQ